MVTIDRKYYKLKFHPSELSFSLWLNPNDRHDEELFFQNFVRHNDNIIDIGSNIGTISIICSKSMNNTGKIFSFEPHPKIYHFFQENIVFNSCNNITSFNVALGDKPGKIYFSNLKSDDQNRILSSGPLTVPIKKLDDYEFPSIIDLMKIDVEGYELFVLKGGENTLDKTNCIYFESLEKNFRNYDYELNDIIQFLKTKNFLIYQYKNKKLIAFENSSFTENLLAIKDIQNFKSRLNILN